MPRLSYLSCSPRNIWRIIDQPSRRNCEKQRFRCRRRCSVQRVRGPFPKAIRLICDLHRARRVTPMRFERSLKSSKKRALRPSRSTVSTIADVGRVDERRANVDAGKSVVRLEIARRAEFNGIDTGRNQERWQEKKKGRKKREGRREKGVREKRDIKCNQTSIARYGEVFPRGRHLRAYRMHTMGLHRACMRGPVFVFRGETLLSPAGNQGIDSPRNRGTGTYE